MVEWPTRTLGDLVTLQRGMDLPTSKRSEGEVPVMGSFGITGYHNEAAMPGPGVTVGRSGASIGVVSYIDGDYWPLNTCLYVKDFHGNNQRFTYYLLSSLDLSNYNSGSAQPSLNRNFVHPIPLVFPARNEQDLIAEMLGSLDDKIELNRRMNEALEAMARAIFKDWFVDFGPTRAKAEGRAPYLAHEIWDLFPDALDDEGKPVGWSFDTLARLAVTNSESWTARHHPPTIEYVDLSSTKWGNIESTTLLDWEAAPSRARRIAKAGDTIMGTTRPGNGSFAYISRDGLTVSTGFAVLSPRSAMYRDTVYIAASSVENIERLANLAEGHGGAYPAVKPNEVANTVIVFPGDQVLASFAALVSPIREKIEHAKAESRTLAQTRDLLLAKLMSGEIRLAEAEKGLEAVA